MLLLAAFALLAFFVNSSDATYWVNRGGTSTQVLTAAGGQTKLVAPFADSSLSRGSISYSAGSYCAPSTGLYIIAHDESASLSAASFIDSQVISTLGQSFLAAGIRQTSTAYFTSMGLAHLTASECVAVYDTITLQPSPGPVTIQNNPVPFFAIGQTPYMSDYVLSQGDGTNYVLAPSSTYTFDFNVFSGSNPTWSSGSSVSTSQGCLDFSVDGLYLITYSVAFTPANQVGLYTFSLGTNQYTIYESGPYLTTSVLGLVSGSPTGCTTTASITQTSSGSLTIINARTFIGAVLMTGPYLLMSRTIPQTLTSSVGVFVPVTSSHYNSVQTFGTQVTEGTVGTQDGAAVIAIDAVYLMQFTVRMRMGGISTCGIQAYLYNEVNTQTYAYTSYNRNPTPTPTPTAPFSYISGTAIARLQQNDAVRLYVAQTCFAGGVVTGASFSTTVFGDIGTSSPTRSPTHAPSKSPTPPTRSPSAHPSHTPSKAPTNHPSTSPTTSKPSASPTTSKPSASPTTSKPSASPTTSAPSLSPSTSQPSRSPVIPIFCLRNPRRPNNKYP